MLVQKLGQYCTLTNWDSRCRKLCGLIGDYRERKRDGFWFESFLYILLGTRPQHSKTLILFQTPSLTYYIQARACAAAMGYIFERNIRARNTKEHYFIFLLFPACFWRIDFENVGGNFLFLNAQMHFVYSFVRIL